MKQLENATKKKTNRRSFLKGGMVAGAATVGAGMMSKGLAALGAVPGGAITEGDAAILRFLAAAEILETDLWQQYNELGGVDAPVSGYQSGLTVLDGDMPQYIADNTDDERTHELFINAYLKSKGAKQVSLEPFRNLEGSEVTLIPGVDGTRRLTNLTELTVDTSWWTRYRTDNANPDLGDSFPPAVPTLLQGKFTAIPKNNTELELGSTTASNHVQAIANTAGFHFAFIEQGGTSLYAAMAQKVTNLEVLRIVLSIGGTEIMHFQTWHDKAGNAKPLTDGALVFPDLTAAANPPVGETLQSNLIMPEPTVFLSKSFPICSIIRPTATKNVAAGAVKALTDDGLFIGQSPEFFEFLNQLAEEADAAQRET